MEARERQIFVGYYVYNLRGVRDKEVYTDAELCPDKADDITELWNATCVLPRSTRGP